MTEEYGDLWDVAKRADAVVVTTNAFVKRNGKAAMTAGCALEAAERWPWLSKVVGDRLKRHGNHVHAVWDGISEQWIVTYPVKVHWRDDADLDLIQRSAQELKDLADRLDWRRVVLPRPGCGYGRRDWKDVEPLLGALDDRFVVVTWKEDA